MEEEVQMVSAVVRKNVEAQYVEMMVPLYSWGCQSKIKKALANLKGIYSVNVDLEQQKVTVWGICDKYDVVSVVKKKRKGARFWDSEDDSIHLQESHFSQSATSSPLPKNSGRYLAMIKASSFNLNLCVIKGRSLNWKALKKAFKRSNSF